jgi:NTP pyrophosphatase (non-canonical NTP hydrolase)
MSTINELTAKIKTWADAVFPDRTAHSALCKLVLEEIPEFLQELDSPGEYADILILMLDIANLRGINVEAAVANKMAVNYQRVWRRDPVNGTMHHVRDGETIRHDDLKWCYQGEHYAEVGSFIHYMDPMMHKACVDHSEPKVDI